MNAIATPIRTTFKVGFNLKGDKAHHAAEVEVDNFNFKAAYDETMKTFKSQRIVRALVLIDCVALGGATPDLVG